jgi:hypothetical protein
MNQETKEKVLGIINDIIIDKVTDLVEGMSDNEFVEEVSERIYNEVGYDINENDEVDELTDLIGSRVLPLLHKLMEYGIGKDIPTT